jgi:hypothetical protein
VCTRSTDRGTTWDPLTVLSSIDNYQAWEPKVAADDSGNVYVCWQDAKYGSVGGFAGAVLLRRSTDNGMAWLQEVQISPLPSATRSSISVDNKYVHQIWDDERNGVTQETIQYRGSPDAGTTWCDEQTIGDTLDVQGQAAASSHSGVVYAAWSAYKWMGPPANVYFRTGRYPVATVDNPALRPGELFVSPAYPNPFNPSTTLEYTVPAKGHVSITAFDMLAQRVATLADGQQPPGRHRVRFEASHLSTGVYYVVFQSDHNIAVRVVMLMR